MQKRYVKHNSTNNQGKYICRELDVISTEGHSINTLYNTDVKYEDLNSFTSKPVFDKI